jgi:hypothetical protein
VVIGFSVITSQPAASAATTYPSCAASTVDTITVSTRSLASIAVKSSAGYAGTGAAPSSAIRRL